MTISLWLFPPQDFAAWCELVGEPEVTSHAEYLTLLAAIQADIERQGVRGSETRCECRLSE